MAFEDRSKNTCCYLTCRCVARCVCGDLTSEGEGNSKKKSKKKAAAQMLAKLEALNPPLQASKQKVKNVANKKKNRNLIKVRFGPRVIC